MPLGVDHINHESFRGLYRLDIGGGLAPVPGHVNIDIIKEADIVWDLNKGLPEHKDFHDKYFGKVEGIRSHHLIEHLDTIIPLMNDCYNVMASGALFEISTPLAGTKEWYQDPTHKRAYVQESFLYFIENSPFNKEQREYGITARFKLIECKVSDGWQLEVKLQK